MATISLHLNDAKSLPGWSELDPLQPRPSPSSVISIFMKGHETVTPNNVAPPTNAFSTNVIIFHLVAAMHPSVLRSLGHGDRHGQELPSDHRANLTAPFQQLLAIKKSPVDWLSDPGLPLSEHSFPTLSTATSL